MRKVMLALGAASMSIPAVSPVMLGATAFTAATAATFALPTAKAEAQRRYKYREWRGRNGKRYCRKPDGTTGLVVGGVAGALVGRTIDSRGDRTLGTLLGAAGGALAGREIERGGSRCR